MSVIRMGLDLDGFRNVCAQALPKKAFERELDGKPATVAALQAFALRRLPKDILEKISSNSHMFGIRLDSGGVLHPDDLLDDYGDWVALPFTLYSTPEDYITVEHTQRNRKEPPKGSPTSPDKVSSDDEEHYHEMDSVMPAKVSHSASFRRKPAEPAPSRPRQTPKSPAVGGHAEETLPEYASMNDGRKRLDVKLPEEQEPTQPRPPPSPQQRDSNELGHQAAPHHPSGAAVAVNHVYQNLPPSAPSDKPIQFRDEIYDACEDLPPLPPRVREEGALPALPGHRDPSIMVTAPKPPAREKGHPDHQMPPVPAPYREAWQIHGRPPAAAAVVDAAKIAELASTEVFIEDLYLLADRGDGNLAGGHKAAASSASDITLDIHSGFLRKEG